MSRVAGVDDPSAIIDANRLHDAGTMAINGEAWRIRDDGHAQLLVGSGFSTTR